MIALIGWTGAVAMVAFSFTLWIPLAIIGLALLTIQATATKTWNLVALNVISLVGFVANYIGSMV
jgi:sulfite exporter TauE/SafE